MAFIAPVGVSGMAEVADQKWLSVLRSFTPARPVDEESTLAGTLKLPSKIVISGNWGEP